MSLTHWSHKDCELFVFVVSEEHGDCHFGAYGKLYSFSSAKKLTSIAEEILFNPWWYFNVQQVRLNIWNALQAREIKITKEKQPNGKIQVAVEDVRSGELVKWSASPFEAAKATALLRMHR